MSKKNGNGNDSTELQTAKTADLVSMETLFDSLLTDEQGWSKVDTVLIGNPDDGKQHIYIGTLIGPGEPIEMRPDPKTGEIRQLPTWTFHPLTQKDGDKWSVDEAVTHVIPAPYKVNQDCSRIFKLAEKIGKQPLVAMKYLGKVRTNNGVYVNDYDIREKFI